MYVPLIPEIKDGFVPAFYTRPMAKSGINSDDRSFEEFSLVDLDRAIFNYSFCYFVKFPLFVLVLVTKSNDILFCQYMLHKLFDHIQPNDIYDLLLVLKVP